MQANRQQLKLQLTLRLHAGKVGRAFPERQVAVPRRIRQLSDGRREEKQNW